MTSPVVTKRHSKAHKTCILVLVSSYMHAVKDHTKAHKKHISICLSYMLAVKGHLVLKNSVPPSLLGVYISAVVVKWALG